VRNDGVSSVNASGYLTVREELINNKVTNFPWCFQGRGWC